jgi:ABC-type lipoprotein export system ATPase subunit/GNAT superfamily N-acetyltransferase
MPAYVAKETVQVGSLKLELIIKEITEAEELTAYESLANFHYRQQSLFGRTARLIVQCFHPNYPRTIGYIELAMPFYMNKARTAVLDRPFHNGRIKWSSWDKETARKFINLVVRVARCVIYPEFRGIGLGRRLLQHAQEFARTRWQVGGVKPQFIEISADMLKYVPFAERAGLHFIGETEGNLNRVAKDVAYLLQNRKRVKAGKIVREEAFGIVDQQVARLDRATALLKQNDWSTDELIDRLKRLRRSASLRDLNLLQHILSLPKPTYFKGLSDAAEKTVRKALRSIRPKNGYTVQPVPISPLSKAIRVRGLTITRVSKVGRTQRTAAVQRAFGISPDAISHPVINNLSFTIAPGQVAMIVGPSGSGKTTLLNFIKDVQSGLRGRRTSTIDVPLDYRPESFSAIRSQRPLIDALSISNVSLALWLLGTVGLSDAFIYFKKFGELSAGQQYRALLAKLIASKANVWIADEFCVNLDSVAANAVAERLARLTRKLNAILLVATPQPELIARALRPDVVIRLTTAWENEVVGGTDFLRTLPPRGQGFKVPSLRIDASTAAALRKRGGAGVIILPDGADVRTGPLVLEHNGRSSLVSVARVMQTTIRDLTPNQLRLSQYGSKKALTRSLTRDRGAWLGPKSAITVVGIGRIDRSATT